MNKSDERSKMQAFGKLFKLARIKRRNLSNKSEYIRKLEQQANKMSWHMEKFQLPANESDKPK